MTKPKEVAKTLKNVLESNLTEPILDKTSDIFPVIDQVKGFWKFNLYSRKPGPAYMDGTDLDMASFLYSLVERGAIINLPTYKSLRQTKVKEGQYLSSKENRHGKIIGIYANKDIFSFGIKIIDMNVVGQHKNSDYIGDFRNFSLTDLHGYWHSGWKVIQFMPSVEENKFLTENKQWHPLNDNRITFKFLIHPNRWTSYYGQYYFITKILIDRLQNEAKNYNQQIKRMLEEGIKYPKSDKLQEFPKQTKVGDEEKIKVVSFQTEIDIPENDSEFPVFESSQENLIELTKKRKYLVYNVIQNLRFCTRATEYAFYTYGLNKDGKERFPSWIKNVKWERDYKESSKARKTWDRLVLFQPDVGKKGVSIRKRSILKTETISKGE